MKPEFIFFDIGYTLMHPAPSFEELFCGVCERHSITLTPGVVQEAESLAWRRAQTPPVPFTLSEEVSRRFWSSYYRLILEHCGAPCHEEVCAAAFKLFSNPGTYQLYEDVLPALKKLQKRGFKLGIISNWEAWLYDYLVSLGLTDYLDPIVISGCDGLEKPDPAIFTLALEKAGVEPEASLYLGDSPAFDYHPALKVGMQAVLIDRRRRLPQGELPVIETLEEFCALQQLLGHPPVAAQ